MASDDESARRLHPRLRCLRNGAAPVNLLRSDISSTVATAPGVPIALGLPSTLDLARLRESLPISPSETPPRSRPRMAKRKKLSDEPLAKASFVNVFVELYRDRAADGGAAERSAVERIRRIAEKGRADAAGPDGPAITSDVLVEAEFRLGHGANFLAAGP